MLYFISSLKKLNKKKLFEIRILISLSISIFLFTFLIFILWSKQISKYKKFLNFSNLNNKIFIPVLSSRGNIIDRNGEILAYNYRSYLLEIIPSKYDNLEDLFKKLKKIIYFSVLEKNNFKKKINKYNKHNGIILRNNINDTEISWFAAYSFMFPEINIYSRWIREYPYNENISHVIGYVSNVNHKEKKYLHILGNKYKGINLIGKNGIEKTLELFLKGKNGIDEINVNSKGCPINYTRKLSPVSGAEVKLSIDINLQIIANLYFYKKKGALVAIENNSGSILALVSRPSFNPNLFIEGINFDQWNLINKSKNYSFINRPICGSYPIGSTYKPFIALASLELKKRRFDKLFFDQGFYDYQGQRFNNAGNISYGMINMHKALVVSSDTYFYSLGLDIGVNLLHEFMKPFSFGNKTGLDLYGEISGLLPSKNWKNNKHNIKNYHKWYPGETISIAVGQGYNSFTVMQLAQAISTLANNGNYFKPNLVNSIKSKEIYFNKLDNLSPNYILPIQCKNILLIKNAMIDVVKIGTAHRAFKNTFYKSAGKTGTAQVYNLRETKYMLKQTSDKLKDHALFIGFAPAEKPEISIALLLENSGWGGSIAAPLARKIFDMWLKKNEV